MLKIISGKYKGIIIPTIKSASYRPSTTRLKEAIFSILISGEVARYFTIAGSKVLDLFCGTGGLGFEALSRGAEGVTFVDIDASHLRPAKALAKKLEIESQCNFLNLNVLNMPKANQVFDLVFIDPPYHMNLVSKVVKRLIEKNWVKEDGVIIMELAKTDDFVIDETKILLITERIYGNNKLLILKIL
jgi:16S rRNA (guanine966-N2)-methyltransferase